jgi:RNA polymerase sigma-70 factor (ECF subfamily)
VKNGSDAFRRLYDANHQRVCGFLARRVGPQEAEDLAQVVFAKAAKGLANFRGDAQISTWLYRIAANVASDWLRSRSVLDAKVTVQLPNAIDDVACDSSTSSVSREHRTSPEQEFARKEMCECIRRVVGQLPDKHRTVLVLGELAGFTDDGIAQTLEISRGNAKVKLHRARVQLKKALEARCDFSRNEDNELVCEPKPAPCDASTKCSSRSNATRSDGQPGSEAL